MRTTWVQVWFSIGLSVALVLGMGWLVAWISWELLRIYSPLLSAFAQ